jgi:hypothetical protein
MTTLGAKALYYNVLRLVRLSGRAEKFSYLDVRYEFFNHFKKITRPEAGYPKSNDRLRLLEDQVEWFMSAMIDAGVVGDGYGDGQ